MTPTDERLSAEERAEAYLLRKLGGRKGFDLHILVDEDPDLYREVINELANEFDHAEQAAAEKAREEFRARLAEVEAERDALKAAVVNLLDDCGFALCISCDEQLRAALNEKEPSDEPCPRCGQVACTTDKRLEAEEPSDGEG